MLKTATLSHTPGDEDRPAQTVVRISDPKRTDAQVHTLLRIMAQCQNILAKEQQIGALVEINPKAEEAAAETYSLACAQLRNLIDDQPRWSLTESDGDKYIERLAEAQLSVVTDQKESLELMRRPHRRYNAHIAFFGDKWIAWIGDSNPNAQTLNGFGLSPAEALADFDENFLKRIEAQKTEAPKRAPKRKKK